jgi:four helix bundle protein
MHSSTHNPTVDDDPAAASDHVHGATHEATGVALDAEKLTVYRIALDLQCLAATLVPAHHRVLQDQLERASLSSVCCIAEGAGRRSRRDKRRFYVMARGSASETAALIDVLRARRLAPEGACRTARSLAIRVVQMATKLIDALG